MNYNLLISVLITALINFFAGMYVMHKRNILLNKLTEMKCKRINYKFDISDDILVELQNRSINQSRLLKETLKDCNNLNKVDQLSKNIVFEENIKISVDVFENITDKISFIRQVLKQIYEK